jgi:hypothetical protein
MNAIMYSLNEIRHQIPNQILHASMTYGEDPQLLALSSLEDKVLRKIIRPRVLLGANVVAGIEHLVSLQGVRPTFTEPYYTVYHIPPDLLMNKEIISVLSITHMPSSSFTQLNGALGGYASHYGASASSGQSGAVMNVAGRIGAAANPAVVMTNAHLELVSRNTVAVYAHYNTLGNFGLRVVLENDENMNNIQPRSYQSFSTLCVLAVKAYIYNKMIIPVNTGFLSGGQELGVFKSIIENYSEADEQYRLYLTNVWAATAFMNDTRAFHDHLTSMYAPDL